MKFPSDIFGFERRKALKIDEENQIQNIINGYPVTKNPFVPDILKQEAKFRTVIAKNGYRVIGFTLAPEGVKLVEPKSLEMIRKRLLTFFHEHSKIKKELEKPLPRNTIAISFSTHYFELGKSCQDFVPDVRVETSTESFMTHQQLSENLQVTYYNDKGVEYLAGYCYYPVLNGNPKLLTNNRTLINLAQASAEPYPLQNRDKWYRKVQYNKYGRYCEKAGKRVLVDCSGVYGKICHKEFDHVSKSWNFTSCDECLLDALTYKFVDPKRDAPVITASPIEQPVKTFEEQIITKYQELAKNSPQFDTKIAVFNRTTGILLEDSKCPKISELSTWLDANPEFNVCNNNALIAHLSLGSAYDNRIGGNDAEAQVEDIKMDSKNLESEESEKDDLEPKKFTQQQETEQEKIVQELAGIEISELTKISQMSIKEILTASIHPQIRELAAFMVANPDSWEHIISTNKWNEKEIEVEKSTLIDSFRNLEISTTSINSEYSEVSTTSINAEYSEVSTSSDSSKNPSPASSTENLMEDYDKIENTTNYNDEFDAEMVNFD